MKKGNVAILREYLDVPRDLNGGHPGASLLSVASRQRNLEMVQMLLAAGAVVFGGIWAIDDLFPMEGYAIAPAFVVTNLVGAMVALWPWTMYEGDEWYPTDGLHMLRIPRMTDQQVAGEVAAMLATQNSYEPPED